MVIWQYLGPISDNFGTTYRFTKFLKFKPALFVTLDTFMQVLTFPFLKQSHRKKKSVYAYISIYVCTYLIALIFFFLEHKFCPNCFTKLKSLMILIAQNITEQD